MPTNKPMGTTQAQQLQAAGAVDWRSVRDMVVRMGGVREDGRGDDRWRFPDGSVALVRGLTFVAGGYSRRHEPTSPVIDLASQELPPYGGGGDVLGMIGRLAFVCAKTMPDVPHEYALRLKTSPADDAAYVALYDAIMHDGVIAFWRGREGKIKNCRPARYLCPGDGRWYWSMSPMRTVRPYAEGRHPLFLSHHINRCTLEAWGRLCARGWIFTDPEGNR